VRSTETTDEERVTLRPIKALKRYADATAPLEIAAKLEPMNPNAHYDLATAYVRAGRKEEGAKEFIHQKLIGTQGGSVHSNPPAEVKQD